ncbi:CARDB domain-containing protein, partial [Crocosphaera sp.]|uniref:CARDB domain-containing protein n=1 Tax=Crocosphaera sp. TaxID=2729996 RepID=UPI003F21FCE5
MIVTLSEPGNSRQDAHNFGTITYNLTPPLLPPTLNEYLDAVGGDDNDDYFQFSLEQRLGVGLNLSLPVGVTLELLDNLGEVIVSQSNPVEPFNTFPLPVSLKNNLDAGTYYIHLFSENADATPYDFDLRVAPPDNAGDFAEEANNLGILTATPVLSDDYVGSSSSYNDEDYYQFTLSELSNVNFELIDGDDNFTSLQIYSGTNTFTNPIDSLFNISSENLATLEKTLVTGIYTVRVTGNGLYNPSTNDSNLASYALSLSATPSTQIDPGNSLEEAHNFGTITYNLTPPLLPPTLNEYLDAVGGDDNDDYFQFSLDQGLGIELNLSLSRGVTLEILDNAGEVILSKSNPVDPFNDYPLPVSLKNNLDAGTYYIHLFSDNADPTIYDFDLIVAPPDNAGDSAEEANNLGMLNTTPVVVEDYVASSSSYDDQDYYQFTLNELSTVNFELTDGDNNFTDLDIYAGTDTFTNPIDSLSNNEENTVTLEKTLAAGIYTVVVSGNGLYNPSINDSNLASYALSLSANPSTQIDPGNSLEEAHNFGTITYNLTPPLLPPTLNEYLDTVGREDNDDYFQFSLDQRLGVEVNLSLLRGVTIELLDDSGEVILSESNPIDPFNDYPLFVFLKDNLDAGTYYIHVFSDNPEPTIYDFDLMVAPPDNAGDFGEEANDLGILTATPVIRDDSVGFSFNNYDDEDIYQFTLSESSTVNLELTDGDNNATNLQIYSGTDTFGSPLDSLFNSYSENFTSLQIALAAGTYTVRVGGDGGYNESIDDYNLASYSLSVAATEDPDPVLTISNTTIVEGDDGTTNAFFTVSLTPAASSIVTVDYSTGDDTAFAGSDYVATSGTLTFNPGELNQTISIPIIGDDVVEETEQFFVNLANPANAAILTSQGIGTIIDSDVADVDLVISSPSSDPITAKIGDNLTFTWTVTNNGTDATTADRWFDHIYISDDDIYDVNDTYVTDYVPNNLSLNPGQSYEVTRFVTLPETDIGDRYLLMITDLANQQTETDETNNTIAIPLQLEAAPDIDLIVSAIEAPTEAVGRQNIDLSWTVENQGTADSTKAMTDYIYLSPNNIIGDEDDILIRSPLFEETVIAGGSRVRTTNLFLPNSLEDGDYYLVIGTDHNNNIFETDETNNFNITEQPLTIASPDLTVSSVNIPSTVLRGETFDITWTVENIGLVDTVGGWSDYLYLSTDQELGNEDDILLTSY